MADSGSILTKSGELAAVNEWGYEAKGGPHYDVHFRIAWANTVSPDALAGGKLRLAGKDFIVAGIYQVEQWSKEEIEVHCVAWAEEFYA